MNWKRNLLRNFKLYAVTDLGDEDPDILRKAEGALRGGVDILQLRSKSLSDTSLLRIGGKLLQLSEKYQRLFIVNNRVDLALALDADGVHLGQDDMPVFLARKILRDPSKIIGKSTHSLEQALAAREEGADYIAVGPVFATPTKPDYRPVGLELVAEVARLIDIPFAAIGGIDLGNVEGVLETGASRVAVVRGIWMSENPFHAARKFKKILSRHALSVL